MLQKQTFLKSGGIKAFFLYFVSPTFKLCSQLLPYWFVQIKNNIFYSVLNDGALAHVAGLKSGIQHQLAAVEVSKLITKTVLCITQGVYFGMAAKVVVAPYGVVAHANNRVKIRNDGRHRHILGF